jgi:hypothetical protein
VEDVLLLSADDDSGSLARLQVLEQQMNLTERDEGEFKIYAGAMEGACGDGYIAAVVVSRVRGVSRPREVFRDDSLACGHRWAKAEEAIGYALGKAREVIHTEQYRLAA